METSPPPVKKLRAMQLTECVREFTLPQQFPSMVKTRNKAVALKTKNNFNENNVIGTTNTVNVTKLQTTRSVQLLPSTNVQTGNNLQKLRIKLPNGKDLGEVNVKLLPQKSDSLAGEMIFSKQGIFKNLNKPITISLANAKDNIITPLRKPQVFETADQGVRKRVDENRVIASSFCVQKGESENKSMILQNKPLILARKEIFNSKRNHDSQEHEADSDLKSKQYVICVKNQTELKSMSCVKNIPTKYIKLRTNMIAPKLLIVGSNGPQANLSVEKPYKASGGESSDMLPETRSAERQENDNHKSINHANMCLSVSTTSEDISEDFKGSISDRISLTENNERLSATNSITNNLNIDMEQNKAGKNCSISKSSTNGLLKNGSIPQEAANGATLSKGKLGKNVMVVLHDNKSNLVKRNSNEFVQYPISNNHTKKSTVTSLSTRLEDVCTIQNQEQNNNSKNENNFQSQKTQTHSEGQENREATNFKGSNKISSSDEKLMQRRSILEKALNSVQDEELRMQALKALAACGIITDRYVPIQPPLDKKLVHDSEVQTVVFGILEKDSFISVSEKEPSLNRIPLRQEPVTNFEVDSYCEPLFKDIVQPCPDDDITKCYLDMLEKEFLKDNEGACQIKNVLSKPTRKTVNVVSQLERDFETALEYNDDGMLNIHKAVVDGRFYDAQRHLMILKGRKESVDIRTDDEVSSLELAIIHEVSPDIVHLLLESGAQPASEEPARDSAILIASRKRSSLLTTLIRYVKSKKSLDMLDSMGFSALHYCARYGDLDGVKALIGVGADVNLRDGRSGRTALFHAVEHKRFAVAQRLLDNGAIANIANYSGQTVLSLVDEIKSLSFRTSLNKAMK